MKQKKKNSEELDDFKRSLNELLEKVQAKNKVLKQKLELAEQLSNQIQKLDINKEIVVKMRRQIQKSPLTLLILP